MFVLLCRLAQYLMKQKVQKLWKIEWEDESGNYHSGWVQNYKLLYLNNKRIFEKSMCDINIWKAESIMNEPVKTENTDIMSIYQRSENILSDIQNIIETSQRQAYHAVDTIHRVSTIPYTAFMVSLSCIIAGARFRCP